MLLVGYCNDEYLIAKAKEYSSDPILVTEKNWEDFIQLPNAVGYTGLEEFDDKSIFSKLLDSADLIEYWPYQQHSTDARNHLEYLLLIINQKQPVKNLLDNLYDKEAIESDLDRFLILCDDRKNQNPQLWMVGPSHTLGVGVEDYQRYGHLLSKKLNKSASFLAAPGAGNVWMADQILRSDIRKDDIVIWWFANVNRLCHYFQSKQLHININTYTNNPELNAIVPKKLLANTEHLLYESMTALHRVNNFCNKIKSKLFIITSDNDISYEDYRHLYHISNFYYLMPKPHVDLGIDNIHPGPKQHQLYADVIVQELEKRNWI